MSQSKRILFDIITPNRVLFFKPIIEKLQDTNTVIITTRGDEHYKEVIELLSLYNLHFINIGTYGGNKLEDKFKISLHRMEQLIPYVQTVDIVVSGGVVDASRVGFALGKKVVNFEDMPIKDHKENCKNIIPMTRLSAPLSTILFKPFYLPDSIFTKLGVCDIREYNFLDPVLWLKDFKPEIEYIKREIPTIDFNKPIVVVREEEFKASYVHHQTSFLYEAIKKLEKENFNIIIIPRYESSHLKKIFTKSIILEKKIILQHLLAYSDLFIGGGGTINIEATYFGIPVISTRSFISHYDKFLIDNKLMWHSNDSDEIIHLTKNLIGKHTNPSKIYNNMNIDIDYIIKGILE